MILANDIIDPRGISLGGRQPFDGLQLELVSHSKGNIGTVSHADVGCLTATGDDQIRQTEATFK